MRCVQDPTGPNDASEMLSRGLGLASCGTVATRKQRIVPVQVTYFSIVISSSTEMGFIRYDTAPRS